MALTDGLVLLFDQDGRELVGNTPAASTTGTATSTQTVAGASRTVRGYGTTMGVGTTDRIRTAATADLSAGGQTWLAWIFVNGAGGGTYGRIYQKGSGTTYHDAAFMNAAATSINVVRRTSISGSQTVGIPTSTGVWQLVGFTTTGSVNGDNPTGTLAYVDGVSVTRAAPTVPTAGLAAADAYDIGNRSDGTRNFDGRIWQQAFWNRVLSPAEVLDAYNNWGQLTGGSPIELAGAAIATASASASLAGSSAELAGAAVATASASASLGGVVTLLSPADRGTVDFGASSVTPNGTTPTIFVRNRYIGDGGGAAFSFFAVSGVNGMTPIFDVDRSNMAIPETTQNWLWSYTGELGSWTPFTSTTRQTSPNVYRSQHGSAFTQDTVYVAMNYPWRVGYTLPWIQSLESSGHVSYAPSGNTSYQFETRSATTNGATPGVGDVIAAQPLYSFRIGTAGNAPDGLPKRKMVLLSGCHASEDVGSYCLKGAVEFLVSADAQAVLLRNWFEIFVYPLVAAAGRAGGAGRCDFENANKTLDVNRQWGTGAMETTNKHIAAINTDAGSVVDVSLDFHGDFYAGYYDYWHRASTRDQWLAAMQVYIPGFTGQDFSATAYTNGWWMRDTKNAKFPITPEHGYVSTLNVSNLAAYGANHMRATAYLVSQGAFAVPAALAGVALAVASASGTLTTAIPLSGGAVSTASASGGLTTSITLAGSALAQAVSTALLSSGITMTAAAVAQAAAAGTLVTAIQMLGSASAQAGASGNLTAGGGLEGNAQASASASASLSTQIRLTGAAIAQASASGGLVGSSIDLAGAAVSTAWAGAELTVTIALTAQALASAIAQGSLTAQILLSGTAAGRAGAGAALSGGSGLVLPAARVRRLAAESRRPAAIQTRRR